LISWSTRRDQLVFVRRRNVCGWKIVLSFELNGYMIDLDELDVRRFLLDEVDEFGEKLTDHSSDVLRHLVPLRLGNECLVAAALASSENNAAVAARLRTGQPKLDEASLSLFAQICRARQIAKKVRPKTQGGLQANSDEATRKLLIGLASDLRTVIVLLYSRLQTLRFHAQNKMAAPELFARETLDVYGPLANRLGMWSLKWELEDLAFRFVQANDYKTIAAALAVKRSERESLISQAVVDVERLLGSAGIKAAVNGRPKHIYSIFNKMRSKDLPLEKIQDLLALRVVVDDEQQCYRALSVIHANWTMIEGEFDDYIAKPKANGYRSLHTVIKLDSDQFLEVQIRTQAMHEFAEFGAAAHWRYKETSTGTGDLAPSEIAAQRLSWVRQLLAWQQEVSQSAAVANSRRGVDLSEQLSQSGDRATAPILVLTPEAKIIELPAGSTPVDFAYHVHTNLGHRCRGARVDGALVPLNRQLKTGQVVDIIVAKRNEAVGPSRDWLNPELGYVISSRARTKVRVWFNEQQASITTVTSTSSSAMLSPPSLPGSGRVIKAAPLAKQSQNKSGQVLVVGVDLLLTQLARCCRPMPPDDIVGYVTRGKGVSIHRADCANFRALLARSPERAIETQWDPNRKQGDERRFEAQVQIDGAQLPSLLRDITEVLAREKAHVFAMTAQSDSGLTRVRASLSVQDQTHLARALRALSAVKGVLTARRR
jgi:GTP pyrophosphokinase